MPQRDHSESLISSLRQQPLLAVIRPSNFNTTNIQITKLYMAGCRHIELAWIPNPKWEEWVDFWQKEFPSLVFGAASVTSINALESAHRVGLRYSLSPVLNEVLLNRSRELNMLLIPGVFSPTEVYQSILLGCTIVKLFPAYLLGPTYWRQLSAPLGPLPFCLASGGLQIKDVPLWLKSGINAVAIGQQFFHSLDPKVWSLKSDVHICFNSID